MRLRSRLTGRGKIEDQSDLREPTMMKGRNENRRLPEWAGGFARAREHGPPRAGRACHGSTRPATVT